MASFSVTITTNTTPAVSVTMSGSTTYQQFKNSLGNYVYKVEQTYTYSQNLVQLQGTFKYSKYDSDGNQNLQSILSVIDPFQSFNSLYIDTSEKKLIIDGRNSIKFNLLPLSSLQIKLFANRISVEDELDLVHRNNFRELEFISDKIDFFEQYQDFL